MRFPRLLAVSLSVCLCGLMAPARPPTAEFRLSTDRLEIVLDPATGALASITNKLTGERQTVAETPFTVYTDGGIAGARGARLVSARQGPLEASFRYETPLLAVDLAYRVRSANGGFVEKFLTVTNRTVQPLLLDRVVLAECLLDPSPAELLFHRTGFSSLIADIPINLFLRYEKGGLFVGIENPYFNLERSGKSFALGFRPRWLLQPGESFASEPAFIGAYKNEGIYALKPVKSETPGKHASVGRQEPLDWGEVWAMQEFMKQALSSGRPPGDGYPAAYNACGGMEYLWRLREAPARFTPEGAPIPGQKSEISAEERAFVQKFAGSSAWTKEIVHGGFRESWLDPFHVLIDHLAEIGSVNILHPGTLWLGNGGFWDKNASFIAALDLNNPVIQPNPYWLQVYKYARSKGISLYGFDCPALGYFPERKDLKYVSRDGKVSGANCYANREFVKWHRAALDRAITDYQIPWWQWDEGWADVNNGECWATNHGHPPGNVSYRVYRNIEETAAQLKRHHPGVWLVGISVFQHLMPWVLREMDESVSYGAPWYMRNYAFLPVGKNYIGDWAPRAENAEYEFLRRLSLTSHLDLAQPVWLADPARREALQAFWRKWMRWASENRAYLEDRRDLFGPPGFSALEGSAHIRGGRGYLFLFNTSAEEVAGEIPLNSWIGLDAGETFRASTLYPAKTVVGIYAQGDKLTVAVAAKQAVVIEISPTSEATQPAGRAPAGIPVEKAFQSALELKLK